MYTVRTAPNTRPAPLAGLCTCTRTDLSTLVLSTDLVITAALTEHCKHSYGWLDRDQQRYMMCFNCIPDQAPPQTKLQYTGQWRVLRTVQRSGVQVRA